MHGDVMPEVFSPPTKRGRKPLVDISGVLQSAVDSRGQWIRYELLLNRAKSMIRQLKMYDDIEVITTRSKVEGMRTVYVRLVPEDSEGLNAIRTSTTTTTDGAVTLTLFQGPDQA